VNRVSIKSNPTQQDTTNLMKNAGKHAEVLKTLAKKIIKEADVPERVKLDPILAIVRGALSYDVPDEMADTALARLQLEFIDLNELRVATELEVIDLSGEKYPKIDERATLIRASLHAVFEKEHTLKLDRLADMKKAELRQYMHELPAMNPFVEAFVTLLAFEHSAIPVDESIQAYLFDEGVLEEETTIEEAQSFIESHIKADDCYKFFHAVRIKALAHESKPRSKKDDKKKK